MDTKDFVGNSVLDILVPQDSGVEIEELLNLAGRQVYGGLNNCSLVASIPQREVLYFGKS